MLPYYHAIAHESRLNARRYSPLEVDMSPANRHSPDEQLEFVLHVTSRSLARRYNDAFRAVGLSQSQAGVLLQVDWADAHTQTEIARRLGIQKAAAGTVIIDLEERGWLKRQRNADDARMIEVKLTPSGRRKVKQINDFVTRLGPLLRHGISDADMHLALDVLARVRANVDAMEPPEA
jgi:DNA-binding MarR family transcriptional regulator